MRVIVIAMLLVSACFDPAVEGDTPHGVQIFAEDTLTARIRVIVTGDLQVTLQGDDFQVLPGRRFLVSTPASMVITRGAGTATIASVDGITRLAVVPIGTPEDSIDAATVAGTVVTVTQRDAGRRTYRLDSQRP